MSKTQIAEKIVSNKNKIPYNLTTEIFKGKKGIPSFITEHKVFKTPMKINKIFPSIGLKNFKESCELAKPLIDLKKENFVSNLIKAMNNGLVVGREEAMAFCDRVQFILDGDEKAAQISKVDDIYNLIVLIRRLQPQLSTYNNEFERVVQSSEGKIVLRLTEDVLDRNNKPFFRRNESLFKVFSKLREQFTANNLNFINLEQAEEFKVFCAENIPNKTYQVVFSSEGGEGAWDLLTMSMRGIKSCQRWDGDYPRCLIGSIVSKYVGIIYITSGAETEFSVPLQSGETGTGSGLKMMRRSLVRYVIDGDEGKPCLIIERIYPLQQGQEVEEETLKVFINALKSKTSLPIYFAPQLGTKVKHFYVPFEKIREEMPERDWTYQDTPLKTNLDLQLHILSASSNEDVNRYINCFKSTLVMKIAESFRKINNNTMHADEEIARTVANIRLNCGGDKFIEQLIKNIIDRFVFTMPTMILDPKECFKKYLIQFALNLKSIRQCMQAVLNASVDAVTSRQVDHKKFYDFIFHNLIMTFIKQELKNII